MREWETIKPGDVFGRLTVVTYAGRNAQYQPSFYCDCLCGNKGYVASAYGLLTGRIKGCNKCWQVKDLAGPKCPIPYSGCRDNKIRGVCCHDCPKEQTCKDACKSSTAPYPNGCGRDAKVFL